MCPYIQLSEHPPFNQVENARKSPTIKTHELLYNSLSYSVCLHTIGNPRQHAMLGMRWSQGPGNPGLFENHSFIAQKCRGVKQTTTSCPY